MQVRYLIESIVDFQDTILPLHATMRTVKAKLKDAAALRKRTELMPVTLYETRGSSIVAVLRRFLEIREQLIELSKRENTDYILKAIA